MKISCSKTHYHWKSPDLIFFFFKSFCAHARTGGGNECLVFLPLFLFMMEWAGKNQVVLTNNHLISFQH